MTEAEDAAITTWRAELIAGQPFCESCGASLVTGNDGSVTTRCPLGCADESPKEAAS